MARGHTKVANIGTENLVVLEPFDQIFRGFAASNVRELVRDGYSNQHMMPWSPLFIQQDIGGQQTLRSMVAVSFLKPNDLTLDYILQ